MSRPNRIRYASLALAVAASLALSACGVGNTIVGVHDAPVEMTTGAPIANKSAEGIAARVLLAADAARALPGPAGDKQRAAVMAGSALQVANAAARVRAPSTKDTGTVERPSTPRVLAVSRGRAWPRAMFVQTARQDGVQVLSVLVSSTANTPYQLVATSPMEPGATISAFDTFAAGSPVNGEATEKLAVQPNALLAEYANWLAYPRATPAPHIDITDRFATQVRANAAAQGKALGALASFTQKHAPLVKETFTFQLRDGGAVVFALMQRTDTLIVKPKGKALVPSPALAKLLRKSKLAKRADILTFETVVFTVPPTGKAKLVGVDEQLISAKGQ